MAGPVYYSTNPWFSIDIAEKYRGGRYFAWICEYFDSDSAPSGSAGAMIAPSSNPRLRPAPILEKFTRIYFTTAERKRNIVASFAITGRRSLVSPSNGFRPES